MTQIYSVSTFIFTTKRRWRHVSDLIDSASLFLLLIIDGGRWPDDLNASWSQPHQHLCDELDHQLWASFSEDHSRLLLNKRPQHTRVSTACTQRTSTDQRWMYWNRKWIWTQGLCIRFNSGEEEKEVKEAEWMAALQQRRPSLPCYTV